MVLLYRDLFILICFGLLIWGIFRIERIYQYPFFMGSIFISFVLPQILILIDYPEPVRQNALERVLLMSCLCAAACWVGYQIPIAPRLLKKLNIDIDNRRFLRGGFFLLGLGWLFYILLSNTTIEKSEAAGGNWTGIATIYYFFGQVIYIAFAIFFLECLKNLNFKNFFFTAVAGWIPLQTVLAGRRQPTMTFAIIIGLGVWTVYRRVPPRWLVLLALFLSIILIPLVGQLRDEFWSLLFSNQWNILFLEAQKSFEELESGKILELKNAAIIMDAVARQKLYGLGAGWWDSIVFQYFPGQIFGFGLKESLQFRLSSNYDIYKLYGYRIPTGSTLTGIGDSFAQFGYLGSLIFGVIGYVFKCLWVSGTCQKSSYSILLYISLVSPAMISITHGIGRFFQEFLFQVGIMIMLVFYSRKKSSSLNY